MVYYVAHLPSTTKTQRNRHRSGFRSHCLLESVCTASDPKKRRCPEERSADCGAISGAGRRVRLDLWTDDIAVRSEPTGSASFLNGVDASNSTFIRRQMEGLRLAKADISAFLHPSWSGDVHRGVLQLLNSLLLRYNEEFDGVVLVYNGLKIFNQTAKILSGLSPYLCLKLTAKLLLFSPKPGMLLEGKVNKVEKDYIGVIVLGIINASIAFADIREEFSYQDNVDEIPIWVSTSDERHVIRIGSTIKFAVKSVQQESFLDMRGSLKPLNTGCANWLSSPLEENSLILKEERKKHKKERSRKKRRREKLDAMVADGSVPTREFLPDHHQQKEHKHRSKRKRSRMDTST